MSTADYRLFASIVNSGSLSAAGREARISPAMVSKRLQRLEERLGAKLLVRSTRRIALTSAGEMFYADICAILSAIDAAESRVSGRDKEPRGPLRITAPTSFTRMHIAPHLHRFIAAYPAIELHFDTSDEVIDLIAQRVDVALRITATLDAGMGAVRLADNQRVLCASRAYLANHGTPLRLADLAQHRLLAARGQLPWHLVSGRKTQVIEGPSYVSTNSSELVRELTLGGVGIALRSLWDVAPLLAGGELIPLLREWRAPDNLALYALTPSTEISAAARVFIRFVKALLAPQR